MSNGVTNSLKEAAFQLLQLSFIALNNDQKITCGLLKSLVVLVFVYFTFSRACRGVSSLELQDEIGIKVRSNDLLLVNFPVKM